MLEPQGAFRLDRARLRASFDRASASYDAVSGLQARIAAELLERLEPFRFTPGAVLDLGSGTGHVTRELKRRYPRARVIALDIAPGMLREARHHQRPWRRFDRVCGDALRLPLRDGCIDLMFSNLMLQWCEPLAAALAEARRVLRSDGFFAFTTLGPDTLFELRNAWAEADSYTHVNHFSDLHEVGDALVRAGLMEPVLDIDRIEVGYPDVLTLMRELKATGAHNVTAGRPRSLTGRARLARVQRSYESFRRDARLPATYEVIYGVGWGAAGRHAASAPEGVTHIAPGSIRRSRRP